MYTKPTTGWNDPPVITPKIKPSTTSTNAPEMPTFFQPSVQPTSMPAGGHYQQQPQFVQNNQPNQIFQPQSSIFLSGTLIL